MKTLKFLIEKEFKQIRRNAIIPKMIIAYPVMVLLIFPWAIDFEVKNIKVDIIDSGKSIYSQRLINKIDASKYFILNDIPQSYDDAMLDLEKGKTDIILQLPSTFDKDLVKEKSAELFVAANAVNSTQGLLGTSYLTQIISDFSNEIRMELAPQMMLAKTPQIEMVPNYKFNPKLDYKLFMLPAFIALMITLICGILPALNIVIEKETGTIQQINTTPVRKFDFILAKLIPFWIIGIFILTVSFLLVWLIYGFLPLGNFLPMYIASVIFIVGISGLGIIVSNYSETLQQAMFLIMFFILIVILLSGLFSPLSAMPQWAQWIAYANPLTYFTQILRLVYLKGSSLSEIMKPTLILMFFAFILNIWAVLSYRKRG